MQVETEEAGVRGHLQPNFVQPFDDLGAMADDDIRATPAKPHVESFPRQLIRLINLNLLTKHGLGGKCLVRGIPFHEDPVVLKTLNY